MTVLTDKEMELVRENQRMKTSLQIIRSYVEKAWVPCPRTISTMVMNGLQQL